jgi:hypothetical protein
MAVVINEFEVVPGQNQPQQETVPGQAAAPQASMTPSEVERAVRLQKKRAERVRAH